MSDFDDEDLQDLAELGKPVAGDDEQMVMFRTLIRATVKLTRHQRAALRRLSVVEKATADCAKMYKMVSVLQQSLAPDGNPNGHIDVRVSRLENTSAGVWGIIKNNSGAIILAVLYGTYQIVQHAAN